MADWENPWRKDFPLLNGDTVYLDTAATAQKPSCVLEAERSFYETCNANPLRGFYALSVEATRRYEEARQTVQKFLHARKSTEIIFTRNATESLNLVAYSYGLNRLKPGDEIVAAISEHHSNLLPWQMVARQTGARLRFLECGPEGEFSSQSIREAIGPRVKLVAAAQVSNVLGVVNPLEEIIARAHAQGAVAVVDAAQSAPHMPIDVAALDADFLAFSGHKIMGPMGIGVLYGKEELLEKMPPFLTGGEMIDAVHRDHAVWAPLPHKFEAGTVNAAGAAGLGAALRYLQESVGFDRLQRWTEKLTALAVEEMTGIPGLRLLGPKAPEKRSGILTFTLEGVHPHDVAAVLDADGIAVRAGHHCAQPLMEYLKVPAATRASIYLYNTEEDIRRFAGSLRQVRRKMGYGA